MPFCSHIATSIALSASELLFQPCLHCHFNNKNTLDTNSPLWTSLYRTDLYIYVYSNAIKNNMNCAVAANRGLSIHLEKGAAAHPRGSVLFRCILPLIIQAEPIKPTIITVISPLFILMQFPISEVIMSIFVCKGESFLRWQKRRCPERNLLLQ